MLGIYTALRLITDVASLLSFVSVACSSSRFSRYDIDYFPAETADGHRRPPVIVVTPHAGRALARRPG